MRITGIAHFFSEVRNILDKKSIYLFYFTNGRYIECLSLTCATNKSKT